MINNSMDQGSAPISAKGLQSWCIFMTLQISLTETRETPSCSWMDAACDKKKVNFNQG